ncbi:MAG: beta-mannosidase [Hyphomicrobiales bacterium]|nr:MAG: beta-mannosidase [Hyphomicrobiales bacterium]
MPIKIKTLSSDWILSCATDAGINAKGRPSLPDQIAATIPSVVHLDLMNAGLVADPYIDLNEIRQDWIGWQDWTYALEFKYSASEMTVHNLVFDGLDTIAEICFNGKILGKTANMNRRYRFDITDALLDGANKLEVRFTSPRRAGLALEKQYAHRPNNYPGPFNYMRKMACDFGWDWGPSMTTSGIFKPCYIESWTVARLKSVRPEVTLVGDTGYVKVKIEIEREGIADGMLRLKAEIAGVKTKVTIAADESHAVVELEVKNPKVWWPHNLGAQPLYELNISLMERGKTRDTWQRKVGFRSIRLDTSKDEIGRAFTLVVNDVPIFVMGANWIPDDCFLPRVTAARYAARIDQAKDANMNLLRIWGGGIYENDEFYEACDEAGMLVWQDFLFACAAYPEDGDLPAEIEAEARENVERLMPYPSLVMWNGSNENIWGFFDWGWKEALKGETWGEGYYLDILPKIVAETDPTRPYWASSPYSGSMDVHPNDPNHGCTHEWDVWNEVGYENYADNVPRFASEFGWQAPPTWATLSQSVHDEPLTPVSSGVWHHQKSTIGNDKLIRGLQGHLPIPNERPESMDDWHYITQLNQARALKFGIEHYRSHRGRCMGSIIWQLNDCWPVTSWSAVDGYGRKKPLWYAMRKVYEPHLLTIQPRGDGLSVVAVNERTLFWRGPVNMKRVKFDGTVLAEYEHWRLCVDRLEVGEYAIPQDVMTALNPREEMIIATMHDSTAFHFFNEDVELDLPEAEYEVKVEDVDGDYLVHITAKSFLRDLCLFVDRIHADAEVDDMLVNMLPDETKTFRISSPVAISAEQIKSPVLRCVNQLSGMDQGCVKMENDVDENSNGVGNF